MDGKERGKEERTGEEMQRKKVNRGSKAEMCSEKTDVRKKNRKKKAERLKTCELKD